MKDSPANLEKNEESASRSDSSARGPTPGQKEKAAAFLRAWPPADRCYPDFTRDTSTKADCERALASLLADEVATMARALHGGAASMISAGEHLDSMHEVLRAAGGVLSDLVQLAGRPDVRAILDAYGASTAPGDWRRAWEKWTLADVAEEVKPWPSQVAPSGLVDGDEDEEEAVMLSARLGAEDRARIARLEREVARQRGVIGTQAAELGKLARQRDEARAECERLTGDLARFLRAVDVAIHGATAAPVVHSECPDGSCLYGVESCAVFT